MMHTTSCVTLQSLRRKKAQSKKYPNLKKKPYEHKGWLEAFHFNTKIWKRPARKEMIKFVTIQHFSLTNTWTQTYQIGCIVLAVLVLISSSFLCVKRGTQKNILLPKGF